MLYYNVKKISSILEIIMVLFYWHYFNGCSESEPKVELSAPFNPTPATGTVNVSTNLLLKWECNNTGGSYTYDLFLGTVTIPPLLISNLSQKQYQKDSLLNSTKYYWKVIVKDGKGNQASSPVWSFTTESIPLDGRGGGIIMYTYQSNNDIHQLYVMNGDGTAARKLITASIGLNHADWSPDGTKIAAVGYMDPYFNTWSIHTFNEDGTNLRRLTYINNVSDTDPTWSPDGTKIAFTRMYPSSDGNYENSRREIWMMNADGSNQRYFGKLGFQPKFSPDGRKLLYTSKVSGNWEIYTCNVDSTNEQRLTINTARESDAVWSPDGTKIAFDSDMNGNYEIYVMNADGTQLRRITSNNCTDAYPRWSPDGSLFVFISDLSGTEHWENYVMNVDGTNIKRLTYTTGANTATCPTWKPK